MSRVRIKYKRQEELRYIGHLDMMRMWHRAFRRADIPLAYSEGFNPHPKMVFAAPLALGMLSDAEFLDIYLTRELSALSIKQMITRELPKGIEVVQVLNIPDNLPTMPSMICKAEYRVKALKPTNYDSANQVKSIMEADTIPWEQNRDGQIKSYDIRQMIHDIIVESESSDSITFKMILRCDNAGSGRPEQVAKALGIDEIDIITRTALIMQQPKTEEE